MLLLITSDVVDSNPNEMYKLITSDVVHSDTVSKFMSTFAVNFSGKQLGIVILVRLK